MKPAVRSPRHSTTLVLSVAGVAVVVASQARPFTVLADVVTAVAIGALVAVVMLQRWVPERLPRLLRRRSPEPWDSVGGYRAWIVLLVAVAAWETYCLLRSPRPDHPTLSYLLDLATAHAAGRGVAFAGWLTLGWFLVTA